MRTDCHKPSEIIPADYTELFPFAYSAVNTPAFNMDRLREQRIGPFPMADIHGGRCDSCGANFVEGSAFLHVPTKHVVLLGHICADKMGVYFDASEAAKISRNRKAARKATIARRQKRDMLRAFVTNASTELLKALRTDHYIVKDIRSRVAKWGKLSEKQGALVLKLADEASNPKPAEINVDAPILPTRQVVTGKVVSTKHHDNDYGGSLKMTVKVETPAGTWLAWGTVPGTLSDEGHKVGGLKGCTIRFEAKLKQGHDSHFALFSRPTKSAIVTAGAGAQEALGEIRKNIDAVLADDDASENAQHYLDTQRSAAARIEALLV